MNPSSLLLHGKVNRFYPALVVILVLSGDAVFRATLSVSNLGRPITWMDIMRECR